MTPTQPNARWTRAWRVLAPLFLVALTPSVVIGTRLADAVPKSTAHTNASAKVVFRDDFNGTRLDASKWNASWFGNGSNPSKPVNGQEDDCYDPNQAIVKSGYLIIAAVPHNCLGHSYMSGLVN